jgi:hypothetical protein
VPGASPGDRLGRLVYDAVGVGRGYLDIGDTQMRIMTPALWRLTWAATLLCGSALGATAREIHVAMSGNDSGNGSPENPLLTIGKASEIAQPGDVITVHEGTYREWVKPVRGGTDDDHRITWRAAPGERAVVKGSERVGSWVRETNGVWRVELPNAFFGDYNPYALKKESASLLSNRGGCKVWASVMRVTYNGLQNRQ